MNSALINNWKTSAFYFKSTAYLRFNLSLPFSSTKFVYLIYVNEWNANQMCREILKLLC